MPQLLPREYANECDTYRREVAPSSGNLCFDEHRQIACALARDHRLARG
ncbi:hypothetical protein J2S49_000285 [Arcanobacterium wilhelmae]|uniref:Uncharacterized protein n=1 Tax=Arcanobacterium wilhelmae TaxID=1803177 RepID=A0ABT9N926_9ACTO|nr:hypothetical protein [Arcanobacterium wilhelmae]